MATSEELRPERYMELYKDLNQVSEGLSLKTVEFSETMTIHRMYLKLEELDVGHLEGAEKVKRLYVFADVVEVGPIGPGRHLARLPGSVSVAITCRLLWVRHENLGDGFIAFPHLKMHLIETGPGSLSVYRTDADAAGRGDGFAVSLHAASVQVTYERTTMVPEILFNLFSYRGHNPPTFDGNNITFSSDIRSFSNIPVVHFIFFVQRSGGWMWTSSEGDLRWSAAREPISDHNTASSRIWLAGFSGIPDNHSFSTHQTYAPALWILRGIPDGLLKDDKFLLSMQTSLLISELAEVAHPSSETRKAVLKHVEWLSNILITGASQTEGTEFHYEYLALSFRAQYMLKTAGSSRSLVVPQLQYDVYAPLINRMAQVAHVYDDALNQFKLFIAQNKILGSYLLEQNRAFAARERDMEVFYSELISQMKIELDSALLKMDQLGAQMEAQSADMEEAQREMEEGLRRFQNRRVAVAMFSVFRAIGAIALTFLTAGAAAPAAMSAARSAVTAAEQAARALHRVLDILDDLQKVMEVVAIIKELVESLQDVGQLVEAPDMPEMPTEADWAIFVNEIEGVAAGMPEEVSEVSAWTTKCKNVAVLGRELMTTAAYISRLQYDITEHAMLQEIAQRHANRLSTIQAADMSSYMEMVMQMEMRTTRIMVSLIKVIFIQNAALMYQCLAPPKELVRQWPLSMETVWSMLMQNEHVAILGLIRLGPSFDFKRTYVVSDIPVSLLLAGEDWEFEIPVSDHTTIPSTWSRVRIQHLEMKFVDDDDDATGAHQPITDTGKVYILLQGSRAFHDRNQLGLVPLLYEAALPLDYHYAYRLDTGETTLSNLPSTNFMDTFMRMTPFTNWRLRLSASAEENQGLDFPTARQQGTINNAATTQIAITFHVSAIRQISF